MGVNEDRFGKSNLSVQEIRAIGRVEARRVATAGLRSATDMAGTEVLVVNTAGFAAGQAH